MFVILDAINLILIVIYKFTRENIRYILHITTTTTNNKKGRVKFLIVSPHPAEESTTKFSRVRTQRAKGHRRGGWFLDKRSFSPCSFRSFLFHTHTHTLSLFYHQLSLFSLVLHLVFNFRSTLRPYARFSAFSPLLFPPFSIQFLSSYLIDLEKGKYTVCSTLFTLSLSLSHCIHTRLPPSPSPLLI